MGRVDFCGTDIDEMCFQQSPVSPQPEEDLRLVRLPGCQDPQVYVSDIQLLWSLPSLSPRGSTADMGSSQTTGPRRRSAERSPVPAACGTSAQFRGSSRTASRLASPRALRAPRFPLLHNRLS